MAHRAPHQGVHRLSDYPATSGLDRPGGLACSSPRYSALQGRAPCEQGHPLLAQASRQAAPGRRITRRSNRVGSHSLAAAAHCDCSADKPASTKRAAGSVTMDELRTQSGDVDFHRVRRMFCVRNGQLTVAPAGTALSHLEWFESEWGFTNYNTREFMESSIGGVFLSSMYASFFYTL